MKNMARLGITLMLICAAAGLRVGGSIPRQALLSRTRRKIPLRPCVPPCLEAEEIIEETQDGVRRTEKPARRPKEIIGETIKVSSTVSVSQSKPWSVSTPKAKFQV